MKNNGKNAWISKLNGSFKDKSVVNFFVIQYAMFIFYTLKFADRRLGSILVMAACHGIKQL